MMTPKMTALVVLACTVAFGALAPVRAAPPQHSMEIQLTYPDANGETCVFKTDGFDSVGGGFTYAATGEFAFNTSNCPQGASGHPMGAVTLNVTPVSGPADGAINTGDQATISWSAPNADACRFDGSNLPAAVSEWEESGYACFGEGPCGLSHNVTQTFTTAGAYLFKLTCVDATDMLNPVTRTATLDVSGGGGTPPPAGSCPSTISVGGKTYSRQLTGTISWPSGSHPRPTDYTVWSDTLGYAVDANRHFTWPGFPGNNVKLYIKQGHYVAIPIHIPAGFPVFTGGGSPYGSLSMTDVSAVTPFVVYTMSWSTTCGDFQPAQAACSAFAAAGAASILTWVVRPASNPYPSSPYNPICSLPPGQTVWLNIRPGRSGDPSADDCDAAACRININNSTSEVGPGLYDEVP